jgi:hypothetical protein
MPGQRRRELWTNRETILSSDLTRVGKLANMEFQQAEELRSMRADFYLPASNTFEDFASATKDAAYIAIPGLTRAPSIDPIAGTFNVTLGSGEGECVGSGTIPADESEYQMARWAEQALTWPTEGQPNPTNPLICLIVATPADVSDELQSRNILVNPDTRETSPANVYKLSRPQATITVLPGAAAAVPLPPACPAGALPLFEVFVPHGASDSTEYQFIRRSWRRVEFPGTSQHGIVKGCVPNLGAVGALASYSIGLPGGVPHRLVIDGELLTWQTQYTLSIAADLTTPPTAAPAGYDMPTYLYLCGGRNTPLRWQGRASGIAAGSFAPVVLVESLTPPDSMGHPTAALSITWGTGAVAISRAAACYIGVRFRAAGTTGNVDIIYSDDWLFSTKVSSFVQPVVTAASPSSYTSISMVTVPATATAMKLTTWYTGTNSTLVLVSRSDQDADSIAVLTDGGSDTVDTAADATLYYKGLTTDDSLNLKVKGFNMNIPRLSR